MDVIIIGAFSEIVELCEQCGYNIIGLVDNMSTELYMGYPIIGSDKCVERLYKLFPQTYIVIGPDNSKVKRKLFELYSKAGFSFATVVSPKANISRTASIGEGSIIQAGVNISSDVSVGRFCKLNFNANIMHDVTIGDFSIIAPCANVLGRTRIGENVYVGASSSIEHDSFVEDETRIPVATYFNNKSND